MSMLIQENNIAGDLQENTRGSWDLLKALACGWGKD